MLLLFELFLFLIKFIQSDTCLISNEKIDQSLNAIHPIKNMHFFRLFSDYDLCFSGKKMTIQHSFRSKEYNYWFFIVVSQRRN